MAEPQTQQAMHSVHTCFESAPGKRSKKTSAEAILRRSDHSSSRELACISRSDAIDRRCTSSWAAAS